MMKPWIALSLGAAVLGACSKKEDRKPAEPAKQPEAAKPGPGERTGSPPDPRALPAALAAWIPASAKQAWQGAFASRLTVKTSGTMSLAGDPAAIEIRGDKVTVFDGTDEHELELVLDEPCTAGFRKAITEGSMAGGAVTFPKTYLVVDGKVLAADGAIGYRKGKAALACTSEGLVLLDEKGACARWKRRFGAWEAQPETCAWSEQDGKEVLTAGAEKLYASEGDTLQSEQFRNELERGRHRSVKDYAEAKELVVAEIAEKAKAKGR